MLDNYKKIKSGVIKQIQINDDIKYNIDYIANSYDRYGEMVNYISYLRLGYLLGTIGRIPNSILDIGYGNGAFLKACKNIIGDCYGNDITNYELPEGVKFISDINESYFEVVTFFDSLEHFRDIHFVKNINCKYILISVPWCHYESDEWFENWKHRRPNEHIYHFNEESLCNFMDECGFKMLNITNVEDTVRKSQQDRNIMTGIFEKK